MLGHPSHGDLSSQDTTAAGSPTKDSSSDVVLEMVYFGGTILMAADEIGGHKPFFTPLDIAYYQAIDQSALPDMRKERLIGGLLRNGSKHYPVIRSAVDPLDTTELTQYGEKLLNGFGFHKTYQELAFPPIDSINFDVETHLPSLLREVKHVMHNGHIPIILGGTDSLSKYGPLLDAELTRAGANHLPVLIVSSMCAFGDAGRDNQDHVLQLFKAAKAATHQLIASGKTGVYALVPEDKAVTAASLRNLAEPVEKISGNVVKAFVGLNDLPVDLAAPPSLMGEQTPSWQYSALLKKGPESLNKSVMLPIESYNNPHAVTHSLQAINAQDEHHFDAILIKGLPISNDTMDDMSSAIRTLKAKGTQVVFVDGFKYSNKDQKLKPTLKEGELEAKSAILRTLLDAGAAFRSGISSTQAYIQASMGDIPNAGMSDKELPAYNDTFFTTYAKRCAAQEARRSDALAVEFFPNSAASQQTFTLLSNAGMDIVTANYTQGAMPKVALPPQELTHKPTVTFHTAGKKVSDSLYIEAAILDGGYAPHVEIRDYTTAGGEVRPKDLLLPKSQIAGNEAMRTERFSTKLGGIAMV